ncbi:MAG: hypothetical protein CR972_04940 [Candidatus Moraniibacteriota bacterium]|nr:MAG: hypothetical protein CR972_04940 [Candidatus Moranbacteria bacterium]
MNKNSDRNILTGEDFDTMNTLTFLEGLTAKVIDAAHTVDNHANVMVGLNTGIFALVVSKLFEVNTLHLTMGVVAIFSAFSALAAIFAIRLPRFFGHKEREKSILHTQRIAEFGSAESYADELQKMLDDDREIFRQHALEAYNLSKFYYIPKRKMLTYSRLIFIFGVMASGMFLLMEKLHWFSTM